MKIVHLKNTNILQILEINNNNKLRKKIKISAKNVKQIGDWRLFLLDDFDDLSDHTNFAEELFDDRKNRVTSLPGFFLPGAEFPIYKLRTTGFL